MSTHSDLAEHAWTSCDRDDLGVTAREGRHVAHQEITDYNAFSGPRSVLPCTFFVAESWQPWGAPSRGGFRISHAT